MRSGQALCVRVGERVPYLGTVVKIRYGEALIRPDNGWPPVWLGPTVNRGGKSEIAIEAVSEEEGQVWIRQLYDEDAFPAESHSSSSRGQVTGASYEQHNQFEHYLTAASDSTVTLDNPSRGRAWISSAPRCGHGHLRSARADAESPEQRRRGRSSRPRRRLFQASADFEEGAYVELLREFRRAAKPGIDMDGIDDVMEDLCRIIPRDAVKSRTVPLGIVVNVLARWLRTCHEHYTQQTQTWRQRMSPESPSPAHQVMARFSTSSGLRIITPSSRSRTRKVLSPESPSPAPRFTDSSLPVPGTPVSTAVPMELGGQGLDYSELVHRFGRHWHESPSKSVSKPTAAAGEFRCCRRGYSLISTVSLPPSFAYDIVLGLVEAVSADRVRCWMKQEAVQGRHRPVYHLSQCNPITGHHVDEHISLGRLAAVAAGWGPAMLRTYNSRRQPDSQGTQISHLCHNKECFNPRHVWVEFPEQNHQRSSCRNKVIFQRTDARGRVLEIINPCSHERSLPSGQACILPTIVIEDEDGGLSITSIKMELGSKPRYPAPAWGGLEAPWRTRCVPKVADEPTAFYCIRSLRGEDVSLYTILDPSNDYHAENLNFAPSPGNDAG